MIDRISVYQVCGGKICPDDKARSDFAEIARKMFALEIILTCPLWPKRELLNSHGHTLHDRIVQDGKLFSLLLADDKYDEALAMAAGWSELVTVFMDHTLINDSDPIVREANLLLLAVHNHYTGTLADLSLIQ